MRRRLEPWRQAHLCLIFFKGGIWPPFDFFMSHSHLKPLLEYIQMSYPKAYEKIVEDQLINPNLFSPLKLDLPHSVFDQVTDFVDKVYKIKETSEYQQSLPLPENFKNWPQTPSVLTCFDFHYSEDQGLKLIEINTNASLYLPIILQRCANANICERPQFQFLYESFVEAFQLKAGDGVAILDEEPSQEGLYFEFLIFKEWLDLKGHPAKIYSLKDYPQATENNVYNRFTDFYFERPESKLLLTDYLEGNKRFSPNPREYFLIADKNRMMPLKRQLELSSPELATMIPETKTFMEFDSLDELWSQRKKYFFKPGQSFGSKGAFSGKSISRTAFDRLDAREFIAQELCPAGKRQFTYQEQTLEMKYDLRFFTFNGKIQNYGARLYQGQTTNMKTPLGGVASILWQA